MRRPFFVFASLVLFAACVPADGTFGLGSAEFTVKASRAASFGFIDDAGWSVTFDRIVLGFRTMTIGKVGDPDRCAFRGRGERSDIVFDPRETIVQTFNGITPANCEDTGIFLSPPGDTTEVGPGVSSDDLVELAQGNPAHVIIDATARRFDDVFPIHIRLDAARTASRFGGCTGQFEPQGKGIRVVANQRTLASTTFAPENMFQDSLGFSGGLRVDAFVQADRGNNNDGEFTMEDAEQLDLRSLRFLSEGYQAPSATSIRWTFADFLRFLFRFTFRFKEVGTCVGNEPGSE